MKIFNGLIIAFCTLLVSSADSVHSMAQGPVVVVTARRDIPASNVISENDVRLMQWQASRAPADVFSSLKDVVGQQVLRKVFAGGAIQASNLATAREETGSKEANSSGENIVSIPVSIDTKYSVGELVRLVYQSTDGQRNVVADELKVFNIGEPEGLQNDSNGEKVFVRYVSVLASTTDAEKISRSINENRGVHSLEKIKTQRVTNVKDESLGSSPSTRRAVNTPNRRLPQQQARDFSSPIPPVASNPAVLQSQLRRTARVFESQAADLEDQGQFQKADLIREACQKLREAARIN